MPATQSCPTINSRDETIFRSVSPLRFSLSATARPHNFTLRFKSSTSLRHFVCAVERPVAVNVTQPGKHSLYNQERQDESSSITNTSQPNHLWRGTVVSANLN